MVTEASNTVYDCGTCGRGVYWQGGQWHHMGLPIPCDGLTIVEVKLPVPVRSAVEA